MTTISFRTIDAGKIEQLEVKATGKRIGTATKEQPGLYHIILTDPPLEKRVRVREQFRSLELADEVTNMIAAVPA